jgi:glycosyltransferase involved in cell wall biosynthesis
VFPPEPVVSAMLSKDIAEELSQKHNVVVLCPQPTRPEGFVFKEKFESGNYEVHHLDSFTSPSSNLSGRFRESYSFGTYSSKYIHENANEIECIYINAWPLFSQYKIIKAAKRFNIPSVIHIQDIYPESLAKKLPVLIRKIFTWVLLPVDKFVLNNATSILGISPNMISYLSKSRKVGKKKFQLIRNWQNDDMFMDHLPQPNNEKNEFVFMYAGSISQSAGVATLIESFNKAKLPNAKLIIAGNGSDKENCIAIAQNLGNKQIEFCDVTPRQIPALQSQSDILLLPLKKGIAKTATPSKLTAYLLSSKPVIACVEADTDVASIINEANCGFVAEPENADAITTIMKKSYSMSRHELEELGNNGRRYATLNLSRKANLSKLITIIEDITLWK